MQNGLFYCMNCRLHSSPVKFTIHQMSDFTMPGKLYVVFLFVKSSPFVSFRFFNIVILSSVGLKFSFSIFVACLSQSSIFHAIAWCDLRERSFSCSSYAPSQMNWNTAHNNMISNHFVLKCSLFVRFCEGSQTPNISVNNFW